MCARLLLAYHVFLRDAEGCGRGAYWWARDPRSYLVDWALGEMMVTMGADFAGIGLKGTGVKTEGC